MIESNKHQNQKNSIFLVPIDDYYAKDQINEDHNYSYDGLDVNIVSLVNKSMDSIKDEDLLDSSTIGTYGLNSEEENIKLSTSDLGHTKSTEEKTTSCDNISKSLPSIKSKRKLTDLFSIPWSNALCNLKEQITKRINKNNILEGNKVSFRKLTYDVTTSFDMRYNHGLN